MPRKFKKDIENYAFAMKVALAEATKAREKDEVPVGAVILDGEGKILAKAHNQREKSFDPSAHDIIVRPNIKTHNPLKIFTACYDHYNGDI